jgi:hypothetical protein
MSSSFTYLPAPPYCKALLALNPMLISIVSAFVLLAFCATNMKADEGGYRGTVLENLAAAYKVQTEDGELLDVEWNSGYDSWTAGDRVMLTTVSGEGFMYNEDEQTQVDVFPWNP